MIAQIQPELALDSTAIIGCDHGLVRNLRVLGNDMEENGLLPKRRLATAILPLVSGGSWATQCGNDLGSGVVGKVGVETHGRRIHGKNKSAMRKIVLVISLQCGQIACMSNTNHITNQNLSNIHRTDRGSLVGYHKATKRWFIYHESQYTGGWFPW